MESYFPQRGSAVIDPRLAWGHIAAIRAVPGLGS